MVNLGNIQKKKEDFHKAIKGISFKFPETTNIVTSEEQLKKMGPSGVKKVHDDLNEYIKLIIGIISKGCRELQAVIEKKFKYKIISESYKYLKPVKDAARRVLGIIKTEKFSVETSMQSFAELKGAMGLLANRCSAVSRAKFAKLLFGATLDYQPIRDEFREFAYDIATLSTGKLGETFQNSVSALKTFEKSVPKS